MTMTLTRPCHNGRAGPTLADQLNRLDRILDGLAGALNDSVANAVTAAIERSTRTALATTGSAPTGVAHEPELALRWRVARVCSRGLTWAIGSAVRQFGRVLASARRGLTWAPGRCAGAALAGAVMGATAGLIGLAAAATLGGLTGTALALLSSPVRTPGDGTT